MRSVHARLVLLAAFAALLVVAAFDRAPYFCRMMGRAVTVCCCAAEHEFPSPNAEVTIDSQGCCERIAQVDGATVASVSDVAPKLPAFSAIPAPVLAPVVALPDAQLAGVRLALARAPPAIGPPFFIAHCALLI